MRMLPKTAFNPKNRRHVARLHEALAALDAAVPAEDAEVTERRVGDKTRRRLNRVLRGLGDSGRGGLTDAKLEKLNQALVDRRFSSKRQVGNLHRALIKAAKIAKVNVDLGGDFKKRSMGRPTATALRAFQTQYGLPATGKLTPDTIERLESVTASTPPKDRQLVVEDASELRRVRAPLRLNMAKPAVADLQKALAWAGVPVSEKEYKLQRFGKSTRAAVSEFQARMGMPRTGEVDRRTAIALNLGVDRDNPDAAPSPSYRVRGSVRDEHWDGTAHATVEVYEKTARGKGALLTRGKSLRNGFFDLRYDPPLDPETGEPKANLHLVVEVSDTQGNKRTPVTRFNARPTQWVNFTEGDTPYRGRSRFAKLERSFQKSLSAAGAGAVTLDQIEQSDQNQDVAFLRADTGASADDVMKVSLAHRVASSVGAAGVTPEVVYAFLQQNLPPDLPSDWLPDKPNEWGQHVGGIVDSAMNGIVFLDDETQKEAIDTALESNLVSRDVAKNRDAILQALKGVRRDFALEKPILLGNGNLKTLLELSSIPPARYGVVADGFLAHWCVSSEFWKVLETNPGISKAQAEDFQRVVDLGAIAVNHAPTLVAAKQKLDSAAPNTPGSVRDFAKLDEAGWRSIVGSMAGAPPDGASVADYARTLKANAERAYPGTALLAELQRPAARAAGLNHVDKLATFLDGKDDFDLREGNLDQLNKPAGPSAAPPLDKETLAVAKVIQRVHRVATSAATARSLLNTKLHSSLQIYAYGRDRLVARMKDDGIDREQALKVYAAAEQQYASVLAMIGRYRAELHRLSPRAIESQVPTPQELADPAALPNLESLFGSLDYCDCKHCQSVYSPAAYLTDVLRFLGEKDSKDANKSVRAVLFERRPDLPHIKLSCANTDTPLPYIDLLCEILENAVPGASGADPAFQYETTLTPAELRAAPEYVLESAYETLKSAKFPIHSSLNLWQEEARAFLRHLGVPRHELMEAFQNRSSLPTDASVAAEFFGLSSQEHALVTTVETTASGLEKIWVGIDTAQAELAVGTFLQKAKLGEGTDYQRLIELLQCRFVDPPLPLMSLQPPGVCDVDQQKITGLTLDKFDRLHRFLRLWRHTSWELWELNLLILSPKIGARRLDDACLVNLRAFRQVQERLSLGVEQLLAFYEDLGTTPRTLADPPGKSVPPLFERLFQNPSVTNPLNPAFALRGDRTIDPLGVMTDEKATLQSALSVRADDLDRLLERTGTTFDVATMSALYRLATLAKQMRLSVEDLLRLLNATGTADPFQSVAATRELLRHHERIARSGLSLLQLEYVLTEAPDSAAGVRVEVVTQWAEALRKQLDALRTELLTATDSPRELLEKQLGKLAAFADPPQLSAALDLIEGRWDGSDAERLLFIDATFGAFVSDVAAAKATLTAAALTDAELATRVTFVLGALHTHLSANAVREHVSAVTGLSNERSSLLLDLLQVPASSGSLLAALQDERLIARGADGQFQTPVTPGSFADVFAAYRLLHKVSVLLDGNRMSIEDLEWFATNHGVAGTVDLGALPVTSGAARIPFGRWVDWQRYLDFSRAYPEPEETSLRQILTIASDSANAKADILAPLARLTTWGKTDLTTVDTELQLRHQSGALDYTAGETYERLERCFRQMRNTGADAARMVAWARRDIGTTEKDTARETREAAKSKYDQSRWLEIAGPIQDELREKKRDGLVAHLVEQSQQSSAAPPVFRKPVDLYQYYLIDPEMSSCQLTSRIKQAICSVQLFVQRCFLGLERSDVEIVDDDPDRMNNWSHWKWMKSYRVWEANRKVFLYPENWILPELRDDKTPFFRELEDELLGGEITPENVEAAFVAYLEKVDEVANLEICGLYQEAAGSTNRMHVVARTRAIPPAYFHRHFDLNDSTWSPWERIEVEIGGDHVIPVVFNRKLHVFWLEFTKKPIKIRKNPAAKLSNSSKPEKNPEPAQLLEIQIGWTVKTHRGWSRKQISRQKLVHPWERPLFSYNVRPRYKSIDNTLWLDLFISTSEQFNDRRFYDQFSGDRVRLTDVDFDERYRPWHASSFVFNGDVLGIKLRGLPGKYFLPNIGDEGDTSSFEYVRRNFPDESRSLTLLVPWQHSLRLPEGMHNEYTYLTNNTRHAANSSKLTLLEGSTTRRLLRRASAPFRAVMPQQDSRPGSVVRPFVYQDAERAFFVQPEWEELLVDCRTRESRRKYRFSPLYHPYTALFIRELNRTGLGGLFQRRLQTQPESFHPRNRFAFRDYLPTDRAEADSNAAKDVVDFSLSGAYSVYNWEIFFHAPLMLACKLSENQKFEDAMRWFHHIFDPTSTDGTAVPQKYWITRPFFEQNAAGYRTQLIANILDQIGEFSEAVRAWKDDPFKPHLIARYRPVAYQRTVVMKYISNLIAWGDQRFRRDSIESNNEATLLYVLAGELLGERPRRVPSQSRTDRTFQELLDDEGLDIFGNSKVEVLAENLAVTPVRVVSGERDTEPLPRLEIGYFCVPDNDKLSWYWDTVADRLFKLRHCLNIEGVFRQLPLFEPPIDPALLVKAAAAGVDLDSVIADLSAPLPHHRFVVMVQRARQLAGEVRTLGNALLSALEKRDAESIAALRAGHQKKLLSATKDVRKKQLEEAQEQLSGLEESRVLVEKRLEYYSSREFTNASEQRSLALEQSSIRVQGSALNADMLASQMAMIPEFVAGGSGAGGSPHVVVALGGKLIAKMAELAAKAQYGTATLYSKQAGVASTMGSHQRRAEDWAHQADLASQELRQMDRQIAAASIRVAIAEGELENLELQIEHAEAEHDFLTTKYTNAQLYGWMTVQISTLYFQGYQLAYDVAKRAERCFRYELDIADSSFISFGYWDSLKKGLLAGDRLTHDLDRLDAAYLDQNRRDLEITKRISLADVAPMSLARLIHTGECTIDLPEWLFDMDYPGHYLRRIKSVSVSIPCVVGPYTSINCTLTLESSSVRITPVVGASGYARDTSNGDPRFADRMAAVTSIATSHAQNDTGMFELRFNDERYLPFEGAGAAGSRWHVALPRDCNQFDFATISDVILTLQYTARAGGAALATAARAARDAVLPDAGARLWSLRHGFPSAWHRFLHPPQGAPQQELSIDVTPAHFPFLARGMRIKAKTAHLVIDGAMKKDYVAKVTAPGQSEEDLAAPADAIDADRYHMLKDYSTSTVDAVGEWKLKIRRSTAGSGNFASLPVDDLRDAYLILEYATESP